MMTKDKAGHPVFQKGESYTVRTMFTPLWAPGVLSTCMDTQPWRYGNDAGEEELVENGKGLFTLGDDSRYYVASEQFDRV
jgi:hypothetical protein